MGKSRKKTPIIKDKNKGMKTFANKKVRKTRGYIPSGSSYRKLFPSYDISDYSFRETREERIESVLSDIKRYLNEDTRYVEYGLKGNLHLLHKENLTIEEIRREMDISHWEKYYYRK